MKILSLTSLVSFGIMALGAMLIVPAAAFADTATARLGGGNALMRVSIGQSQGITHSNSASNLFSNLTFASMRGGMPEETPPEQDSSTGGGTSTDQSNGSAGANGAPADTGNGNNGGASAGNGGDGGDGGSSPTNSGQEGAGGNGGDAGPGGLVRAGNAVSNSTAINAINTSIVRISLR